MSFDSKKLIEIKEKGIQDEGLIEEETYRFFDYVKEKPSVAIAICSAAVAIGTALLNLLAYLIDKRYLAFWNISEDFIQINSVKTVYFIFALILTSTFSLFFQIWSKNIMQKHFKCIRPMMIVDIVLGYLKKTIKHDKKLISRRQTKLKATEENEGVDSEGDGASSFEKQIEALKNKNKKIKKETESIRKTSKKEARKYKIILVAMIGIMVFIQTIIVMVYLWIANSSTNNVIIPSIIISVVMVIPFFVIKFFYNRKRIISQIKNSLKSKNYSEILLEEKDTENSGGIRNHFSDGAFKSVLLYMVVVVLITIIVTYFYSSTMCESKDEFHIYEHDGNEYAYIYENDDYLILERVEINENNNEIIIYATEQYFVEKTNVKFEFKKFEKVNVLRYK